VIEKADNRTLKLVTTAFVLSDKEVKAKSKWGELSRMFFEHYQGELDAIFKEVLDQFPDRFQVTDAGKFVERMHRMREDGIIAWLPNADLADVMIARFGLKKNKDETYSILWKLDDLLKPRQPQN
jgi:hypothetical protein